MKAGMWWLRWVHLATDPCLTAHPPQTWKVLQMGLILSGSFSYWLL